MNTAKQTKEAKNIVVEEELNKYKNQPLPQHKTDSALRNIGSALKAVQEAKEQQHRKNPQ